MCCSSFPHKKPHHRVFHASQYFFTQHPDQGTIHVMFQFSSEKPHPRAFHVSPPKTSEKCGIGISYQPTCSRWLEIEYQCSSSLPSFPSSSHSCFSFSLEMQLFTFEHCETFNQINLNPNGMSLKMFQFVIIPKPFTTPLQLIISEEGIRAGELARYTST